MSRWRYEFAGPNRRLKACIKLKSRPSLFLVVFQLGENLFHRGVVKHLGQAVHRLRAPVSGYIVRTGLRDDLFKLIRSRLMAAWTAWTVSGSISPCLSSSTAVWMALHPSRSGLNSSPKTACGHWPSMLIRSRQTVKPSDATSKGMLAITSGLIGVLTERIECYEALQTSYIKETVVNVTLWYIFRVAQRTFRAHFYVGHS